MKYLVTYLFPLLLFCCSPSAQEIPNEESDSLADIGTVALKGNEMPYDLKLAIRNLKKDLKNEDGTIKNKSQAVEYIQTIKTLANRFPTDADVPRLLSTAAETCRGIGANNEALALYGQVFETYPEHPLAPPALFIQGFILENEIQNKSLARRNYERFLSLYPNHEFAATVKLNLQQLDMSPEELIKTFQKRNQN